ncbi:MAG: DNA/RNA nuclease SfsA, partial [Calditrichaeota bacterium]
MILKTPLLEGVLIKRYKRFLADVQLISGEKVTVFCPNSGSMKGCNIPGSPVLLSKSNNPARKYEYTWELVKVNGVWVGINTHHPNYLVREAIESRKIPELDGYTSIRMEVPYGRSRMDMLLEKGRDKCYVEVKNVTLVEEKVAKFPDAVTTRGQKHLRELMDIVKEGYRGVIFFVVQR